MVVEGPIGDVGQAGGRPRLAHPLRCQQRVGPVDGAAATDSGTRGDVDRALGGREEPAAQEQRLVGGEFELHEVGFVAVAAGLHDDHLPAGLGQQTGGQSAAAARSDDHDVGLQCLSGRGGDDRQRLRRRRRRLNRAGVSHLGPERVAAVGVGNPVGEHNGELFERRDSSMGLRGDAGQVADDRLAHRLRLILQSDHGRGVEQLRHPGELLAGQVGHQIVLGDVVRTDVAALGGVVARRVVVAGDRGHEGINDSGQGVALAGGECGGHGYLFRVSMGLIRAVASTWSRGTPRGPIGRIRGRCRTGRSRQTARRC